MTPKNSFRLRYFVATLFVWYAIAIGRVRKSTQLFEERLSLKNINHKLKALVAQLADCSFWVTFVAFIHSQFIFITLIYF